MFVSIAIAQNKKLSFSHITNKFYDLEALASLPEMGEKSLMASSCDGKSTYNSKQNKYENWTGTEDYFGYTWGWPTEFSRPFNNQTFTTAEGIEESEENAATM